MALGIDIAPLAASPETVAALADLLIETVASGASVTFMHRREAAVRHDPP